MGFFSWVRRVRETTTVQDAGERPMAGLLGAPSRRPPAQGGSGAVVATMPVASPVTRDRLCSWFGEHGYTYFVDNDGDVGGVWRGRLFYFFLFGDQGEILQIRGQWNREFAIERLTSVLEVCNQWNAERIWPKAYLRVRDDGMVHVTCEVSTDLEHGATDAQLGQLMHCGLSASSTFFDLLDELYPDPAAHAP